MICYFWKWPGKPGYPLFVLSVCVYNPVRWESLLYLFAIQKTGWATVLKNIKYNLSLRKLFPILFSRNISVTKRPWKAFYREKFRLPNSESGLLLHDSGIFYKKSSRDKTRGNIKIKRCHRYQFDFEEFSTMQCKKSKSVCTLYMYYRVGSIISCDLGQKFFSGR
jgi:hypothetical protein